MNQEQIHKLNFLIGGMKYLINSHVRGEDISGQPITLGLMQSIERIEDLIKVKESPKCKCGTCIDTEGHMEFYKEVGECLLCDHVRSDL